MIDPSPVFALAGKTYCPGQSLIIAELSANHNGSFERTLELATAAAQAGADAIKIQTFTADSMTIRSDRPEFRIEGTVWEGQQLYDLYAEAAMPWDWQPKLAEHCKSLGVHFFSSPFDAASIDFLETLDVPAYKIASFETVDIPLIEKAASTGKPLIISTGMATLPEIGEAVEAARSAGAGDLALLKCTSAYPSPPEEMNLRTIPHLATAFGVVSGLSDHTMGITAPVVAVSQGAAVIEKHFTLSRADGGPDSTFSLEPSEFAELVSAVRIAEKALGTVNYGTVNSDAGNRTYRRSLYVTASIKAGESFTDQNVRAIRPSLGLPPKFHREVMSLRAKTDIPAGTPLSWDLIG